MGVINNWYELLAIFIAMFFLVAMGLPKNKKGEMIMTLWVARDKDGRLYIYESKPNLVLDIFQNGLMEDYNWFEEIPYYWFPEITFENSPQKVELKLVNE